MIGRIPIALRLAASFAAALTVVGVGAIWWIHDRQELAYEGVAGLDAAQAERLGDSLRDHLLVGMLALVVAGTVIAWVLVAAALRPVERLRLAAERADPDSQRPSLGYRGADDQITRLAQTFEALLDRQAAHVRRERRLLAEAGHELRTPVASILLETELALDADPDELTRAALVSIEEEARHLADTAEALLELARGHAPLPLEPVDVAALVRERIRHVGRRFPDAPAIEVTAPATVPVEAHASALTRALDNLLDNAVIHGGAPVRVTVRTASAGVVIEVADAGQLGEEDLTGLFAPFARGQQAASGTGTGLGLGLARSAMRAMGGDVRLESGPDGTRATILVRA